MMINLSSLKILSVGPRMLVKSFQLAGSGRTLPYRDIFISQRITAGILKKKITYTTQSAKRLYEVILQAVLKPNSVA